VADEYTMTLLGALPLLLNPGARTIANIGFGSGLTAEVVLAHSGVARLDSIEIEPAMVDAAKAFAPRVLRPFVDPRSRIHFEDAKSFFARHASRYDAIISEPSNPWVNGVASLFSTEFYAQVRHHLAPGGVFVQWLQQYEFDDRLLAAVTHALAENFSDFEFWEAGPGDLIAVAVPSGSLPRLEGLPTGEPAFARLLAEYGMTRAEHVSARRLGGRRQLLHLLAPFGAKANSDFHPLVQLEAPRARFLSRSADAVVQLASAPLPIAEMLGGVAPVALTHPAPEVPSRTLHPKLMAHALFRGLSGESLEPLQIGDPGTRLALLALQRPRALCQPAPSSALLEQLHYAAELTLVHLASPLRVALWAEPRWAGCTVASMTPELQRRFALYASIAKRDAPAMLEQSRARLADGGDDENWQRYALLAGVLGAHAAGQPAAAQDLWSTWGAKLYAGMRPGPEVLYLLNWPPK